MRFLYIVECLTGCTKCTVPDRCEQCNPVIPLYKKYNPIINEDECVSYCGNSYYVDNGNCANCDFRCLVCSGPNLDMCTTCDLSIEGVIQTGPNSCGCKEGYVADLTEKKCKLCPDPLCASCNLLTPTICLRCDSTIDGLFLDHSDFQCKCAAGTFRETFTCSKCDPLCTECTGPSSDECAPYKCAYKAYPLNSRPTTCITECLNNEENLFLDSNTKTCLRIFSFYIRIKACKNPCKSCRESAIKCTACFQGFFLQRDTCTDQCDPRFYNDNGICMPCSEICNDCKFRVNYCIGGCKAPYVFKENACLENCGQSWVAINGFCERCDYGCLRCVLEGMQKICKICEPDLYLFQNQCLMECPIGMYSDSENNCKYCNIACLECNGPTNANCIKCNKAYGYLMLADNYCAYPTCLQGTYYNITTTTCQGISDKL